MKRLYEFLVCSQLAERLSDLFWNILKSLIILLNIFNLLYFFIALNAYIQYKSLTCLEKIKLINTQMWTNHVS